MSTNPDVIIIGAGAAGLAAAHRLIEGGRTVQILEARDRIGGRIHTIHDPNFALPIERGAEFVHGVPAETWDIIRAAPLLATDMADEHLQLRDGKLQPANDFWDKMQAVMQELDQIGDRDISFAQFIKEYCGGDEHREGAELALAFVEGFDAARADRISAKAVKEENEGSDDSHRNFRLPNGYDGLINWLARGIPTLQIRLSTIVKRIEWSKGNVRVFALSANQTEQEFNAGSVIVTLPVGVLQANASERGAVEFRPDIPDKLDAAKRIGSGTVVKILLQFHEPFWEKDESLINMSFIHSRRPYFPTWWTFLPARTAALTGWSGGPSAERLSGKGDEFALNEALETLGHIFKLPQTKLRDMLKSSTVSDWQSDPFSRGAYSYTAVGGAVAMQQLAQPIDHTLFFAGEATHFDGQAGTVAGAIASGYRAAEEILH